MHNLQILKTLKFEGDLLTQLTGKYFTIYKMAANNTKIYCRFFMTKPSLSAQAVHDLSFRLRISLTSICTNSLVSTLLLEANYCNFVNYFEIGWKLPKNDQTG